MKIWALRRVKNRLIQAEEFPNTLEMIQKVTKVKKEEIKSLKNSKKRCKKQWIFTIVGLTSILTSFLIN